MHGRAVVCTTCGGGGVCMVAVVVHMCGGGGVCMVAVVVHMCGGGGVCTVEQSCAPRVVVVVYAW